MILLVHLFLVMILVEVVFHVFPLLWSVSQMVKRLKSTNPTLLQVQMVVSFNDIVIIAAVRDMFLLNFLSSVSLNVNRLELVLLLVVLRGHPPPFCKLFDLLCNSLILSVLLSSCWTHVPNLVFYEPFLGQ